MGRALASRVNLCLQASLLVVTVLSVTACGKEPGVCPSGDGLVTLASSRSAPRTITVNADSVYWLDAAQGGSVMTCSVCGCEGAPTRIAGPAEAYYGRDLAVDATSVYWASGTSLDLMKCGIGGCGDPPTIIESGEGVDSIAVDAANIYWTTPSNAQPNSMGGITLDGTLKKCPLAGCSGAPTTLASGLNSPATIAVDATNVYLATLNGSTVAQCGIGGCGTPTTLAVGQANASGVAVDATSVYWIASDTVMKCALGGCGGKPTTLASNQLVPSGIAVDGANVYWVNAGAGDGADGAVMKCATDGCGGTPTQLASGQRSPAGIAVDGTSVYWTNSDTNAGTVMKLTPK
jgi:hypothetical protein